MIIFFFYETIKGIYGKLKFHFQKSLQRWPQGWVAYVPFFSADAFTYTDVVVWVSTSEKQNKIFIKDCHLIDVSIIFITYTSIALIVNSLIISINNTSIILVVDVSIIYFQKLVFSGV